MSIYVLHIANDNRRANVSCHHRRTEAECIVIDLARKLWAESGHVEPLPSGQELLDFLVDHGECVHVYRCDLDDDEPGDEIELILDSRREVTA